MGGAMQSIKDPKPASAESLLRRRVLQALGAVVAHTLTTSQVLAAASADPGADAPDGAQGQGNAGTNDDVAYGQTVLPRGIRSRFVDNNNGCIVHTLEAGTQGQPLVLLLHGFPELAFSWRNQLLPLAGAGFYVLAPDLRGYGRSSGTDVSFEDDLSPFTLINRVTDALGLVHAIGYREVATVIGHDYGSPIAAWCALIRPDVFRSVVFMSAPFGGPPPPILNTASKQVPARTMSSPSIFDELAALPVPRKHYQKYYATREANGNMWHALDGVHNFLRAYYHMKSADWKQNVPFPLKARTASEWAKLPRYYIMDLDKGMAETVAPEMPSPSEIDGCKWLTDNELAVYSKEYERTGFQGGLQAYRVRWIETYTRDLKVFSGRTLDVPSLFIGGESDWGVYQDPGAFERMQKSACTRMRGAHLVRGAGHWVQQEKAEDVNKLLLAFLQ